MFCGTGAKVKPLAEQYLQNRALCLVPTGFTELHDRLVRQEYSHRIGLDSTVACIRYKSCRGQVESIIRRT